MKKFIIAIMCLALYSQFGFSQITGTAHDLSSQGWNTAVANPTNRVCGSCHTPHNALVVTGAPLWNHASTATVFTLYSGTNLDATDLGQPAGTSKLCLSCHDGTVGLDNFAPISTNVNMIAGVANVGTDLSNDHPVSFTYDAALVAADGALHPITDPFGAGTIADVLFSGKMECASCHNVHDDTFTKFQRMDNTNSELCITCHVK